MGLHSISDYRKAQVLVKELEKAIKLIRTSEVALRAYEKYRPVHKIITVMNQELNYLEVFLEQNKIIVETKGQKYK